MALKQLGAAAIRLGLAVAVFIAATSWVASCSDGDERGACTADSECDDGNLCTDDSCTADGDCVAVPADNTICLVQQPHDCQDMECQAGEAVAVANDTDRPMDEPCTDYECEGTELVETPGEDGNPCEADGLMGTRESGECLVE